MAELIRILVVDDHPIVQRGLTSVLVPRNGFQVVGEAGDGEEAVIKARMLRPDVILMDMIMPRMGGLEAIRLIRAENPDAHILVLTSFDEDNRVSAAVKAGALGYLRKDSSPDDLFAAIRKTATGATYLPPEIVQKLIRDLQHPAAAPQPGNELTERELDVLAAISKGMSNQEIAEKLYISTATVRTHVRNLLSKLGVANRTQAALYAVEAGLTSSQIS
jgi:two-component system, NarL family, response regulator LiaR